MEILKTVELTLLCQTLDATQEIKRKALEQNIFLQCNFFRECSSQSLYQLGERCVSARFVNGFHLLICVRRICIVDQHQLSYFIPPQESPIQDAHIERQEGDCVLLSILLESSVKFLWLHLANSSKCLYQLAAPCAAPARRIHQLSSGKYAVCYENGEVGTFFASKGVGVECSEGTKTGWLRSISNLFHAAVYRDSFYDSRCGFLFVLCNTGVSLWVESNGHLVKADTLPCTRDCCSIIPSTENAFTAFLVFSGCGIAPISVCCDAAFKIVMHEAMDLSSSLAFPSTSAAVSSGRTIVFFSAKQRSVGILCKGCKNPFNSGEEENLLSVINIGEPVSAITSASDVFFLYHENGTVTQINRKCNGEVFQQQCLQNPQLTSYYSRSFPAALLFLEGIESGLTPSHAAFKWNEFMVPSAIPGPRNEWELSAGALASAYFLGKKMEHLWVLYSSKYASQSELEKARQNLFDSYQLVRNMLDQGGWLEMNGQMPSAGWEEKRIVGANTVRQAVNAQAFYLSSILMFAYRAIGFSWMDNLLRLHSEDQRVCPQSLANSWFTFFLNPSQETWMDGKCLELVQLLLCRMHANDNEGAVKLSKGLRDTAPFVSEKANLLIDIYLLLFDEKHEETLRYCRNKSAEIMHHQLWTPVTHAMEEKCPLLFPTANLIKEHHCAQHLSPEMSDNLLESLTKLSHESLPAALDVVFTVESLNSADIALYQNILRLVRGWMEHFPLADWRIPIFEAALVKSELARSLFPPTEAPSNCTCHYLISCCLAANGHRAAAARGFTDIARADYPLPVDLRLLMVQRAMELISALQHSPSRYSLDSVRLVQYTLLLQAQLLDRVNPLINSPGSITYPQCDIVHDCNRLSTAFLGDQTLYQLAVRYRAVGGASIELDLLKLNSDAPEGAVTEAVHSMLHYLKHHANHTAEGSVRQLLKEPNFSLSFKASFSIPLLLEFLVSERQESDEPRDAVARAVTVLMEGPVDPEAIFNLLLHSLLSLSEENEGGGAKWIIESLDTRTQQLDLIQAMKIAMQGTQGECRERCDMQLQECCFVLFPDGL